MEVNFHIASHFSPEYWRTVDLRYRILREPLGIDFNYSQLAGETKDTHLFTGIGEEIAACLVLTPVSKQEIKMRQVAVHEQYQRIGIGKSMVKYAEQWAIENGFTLMTLHARATAVPFYLNLHYRITGEPFTEVGIPHRMMEKELLSL
jgi:GNAT superfamily N-acetyltransferase